MSWRLVSIVGPPASGKTTLAEGLAEELPATLVREDYAGNPFLAESYVGSRRARLPGQLYFLLSRVKQLSRPAPGDGGVAAVSDYGFCQDAIYAHLRLDGPDLDIYKVVAERVGSLVHPPDVMIFLDAPTPVLLERIAGRGRRYEAAMTASFLDEMRRRYSEVRAGLICPAVSIDTQAVDVRDQRQRAGVVQAVRERL